jgi:surface antigen
VRLWRRAIWAAPLLLLGAIAGGCSTSYQLGSPTGNDDAKTAQASALAPEITGSIAPQLPPEGDLILVRAAASDVLGRGGKDSSTAWENTETGARGTVTPISSARTEDGRICRDFLASHVHEKDESWLQGEACRAKAGKWQVRNLTPWRRS